MKAAMAGSCLLSSSSSMDLRLSFTVFAPVSVKVYSLNLEFGLSSII
jgi:hypothetical protein